MPALSPYPIEIFGNLLIGADRGEPVSCSTAMFPLASLEEYDRSPLFVQVSERYSVTFQFNHSCIQPSDPSLMLA